MYLLSSSLLLHANRRKRKRVTHPTVSLHIMVGGRKDSVLNLSFINVGGKKGGGGTLTFFRPIGEKKEVRVRGNRGNRPRSWA